MTTVLELRGVNTHYGPIQVLRDINVRIDEGEIVCLLGGNASGKTTTLKTILGYVAPTEGGVYLKEERVDGLPTQALVSRGISMVPENRRLFKRMTVRENLAIGAYLRRDREGIEEDLDRVFGLFPRVKERLGQQAGTLSGGEQQMVAMGRALMARPTVLLMDEPSMGLAPILVEQNFDIIKQINAQGTTIFVVEQNANMALSVADRGYVLQTGRIVLADTAENLLRNPQMREAYLGELELRLIGAEELRVRLPMAAAVDALEEAFRTLDPAAGPLRTEVETPRGSLLLMPAFGDAGVGVKLVTLTPDNPGRGHAYVQASYVLFDPDTQSPEAVLDGTALTALRTAAVSGLATRHLARRKASRLVVFGAGAQARSHLEAMCAVRPVTDLVVVSRSRGPAESLVEDGRDRGLRARLGAAEDVTEADLICTCTTSEDPLFDGSLLPPGVHVNAVGSHRPQARELDTETVRRGRVVVETRDVALAEAGELAIPIAESAIEAGHVAADLAETVRGVEVRRSPEDVTVFKSVGMAFEDLVVARAIMDAG